MATRTASALDEIDSILQPDRKLRLVDGPVEAGIWTAIDGEPGAQRYDSVAGTYDRLIGNRHWQRLIWGNDIARDTEFARAAESSSMGWWLDAGCGTLIFTAPVHAESERPTILFDVSIGMLQRARKRLVEHCGRLPEHVVLIQGDVFALPFRASSFETTLCPGIIHLFDRPAALLESLEGILAPGGGLYLSSLVTDRWLGARMLRLMQRAGETPNPTSAAELAEIVTSVFGRPARVDTMGGMAHVWLTKATR